MKIFSTSYTYIYKHNYHIFDYFKNKTKLFFILPKKWKSTKGKKETYYPTISDEFTSISTWAPLYHSSYPIIRGQLKGYMPRLGSILRKHSKKGDVLYGAYEPNLLVTYLYARIAKRLGLKHVFSTWQNVPYKDRMSGLKLKITQWFLRRCFELSTAGLFGTQEAYEVHKPYLKYNKNLVTDVIPQTGVNTNVFKPGIESDFRSKYAPNAKTVFLFASTFTSRKGPMQTLHAFKKIVNEEMHLIIVGTGELENEMKEFVNTSNIQDKVTFLGWQPVNALAPMYAGVDVLVHPSVPFKGWEEQFGLLMIQAQSCGIPVITTSSGSLEETVLEAKTGLHVKPDNIDELSQAMQKLAENVALRKQLGQNARKYVIDHFSEKSVGERLEAFLTSL